MKTYDCHIGVLCSKAKAHLVPGPARVMLPIVLLLLLSGATRANAQRVPYDYGDAPARNANGADWYPTLLAQDGARHTIKQGYYLGNQVDAEPDGLPTMGADGDDTIGVDDEDGVTFLTALVSGQVAKVEVKASAAGQLDAWIDFNGNGSWADAGDQIFANQTLAAGVNALTFNVPGGLKALEVTYARFRFSSKGGLSFKGLAEDGEVEDYRVGVSSEPTAQLDYGDAPARYANGADWYPTLLAQDGARHKIKQGYYLGNTIDAEPDGLPTVLADGDDVTSSDDEDGVTLLTPLVSGQVAKVEVKASATGQLDAWIDFNGNGSWADAGDQIFANQTLAAGVNALTFNVPGGLKALEVTYARFRFSSKGGLSFKGLAEDGEVEDYRVGVSSEPTAQLDYGDAPARYATGADWYPTLLAQDGARHKIKQGYYLGNTIDAEPDGLPTVLADGDDVTSSDDEDGVTLLTPLVSGQVAKVEVKASVTGQLDAWIDFNGNGSWADAGDQIFANQTLAAGVNALTFNVPGGLKALEVTYARFRFSSKGGLSFKGLAEDGEVEDYRVGVSSEPTAQLDYGDAPARYATGADWYPTLLAQDGARHKIKQGYYLGNTIDAEPDGLPTVLADGDDVTSSDDEDGVTLLTPLVSGQVAKVEVKASAAGQLDAWIDFNGNGSWADAGDQIFANQTLAAGVNALTFNVPGGLKALEVTYARFRFSSKGGLSFKGLAEDGEVEDYRVGVSPEPTAQLDYGDAPTAQTGALGYPTLLAQDGARHVINQRYYLGNTIDAEPDGLPTVLADGDDVTSSDDEDGVTFLTALVSGQVAKVEVKASATGQLDAWIDFNGNGSWADAGDQIFANQTLAAGVNTLTFNVPGGLKALEVTYARFRFSSKGGLSFKGLAEDGEVEDYRVGVSPEPTAQLDYGDAPARYATGADWYPTLLAQDGARHKIKQGYYLGNTIDAEPDGLPTVLADGDDVTSSDDEDGVTLLTPLVSGQVAKVEVKASATGQLDAWIDFNGNGSWADAGDQIFANQTLAAGVNTLTFNVPGGLKALEVTYARFRFSSKGGLSFKGLAEDGEVEDYRVGVSPEPAAQLDYGDAPTAQTGALGYPTLLAQDGARHVINQRYYLGNTIDAEPDGLPTIGADGDDLNGSDDEDGVTFLTALVSGQVAKIEVKASTTGQLDAWIDFNGNGSWADAGDQIFANQTLAAGVNTLTFNVPGGLKALEVTYARFRFSSKGGLSFKGLAEDGEVEDYKVRVSPEPTAQLDYGDAPARYLTGPEWYPTLLSQDGARHKINQRYYLGNTIDAEPDGLPTLGADGDDLNGSDDEDGVTLLTPLVSGQVAKVEVVASAVGQLDAWIDFNGNGSWADAGDQIFANQTLAAGVNTLTFNVPGGLKALEVTYARFRFSSKGGLSFKGLAEDGEVEDYRVGVSPEPTAQLDYGDAPTAQTGALGYPTLLAQDGARHVINQRYYLGNTIDAEPDGLPTIGADGDDLNGSDDEDGVTLLTPLVSGQVAKVEVKASAAGQLDAWIDFNGNGSWADAGDQIFANLTLVAGANTLTFTVPSGLKGVDLTYARFRFSSKGGLSFKGLAEDGELEDYRVGVSPEPTAQLDYGDAPTAQTGALGYPTLLSQDGARHKINQRYYLGNTIDAEPDGLPTLGADGDDLNGSDDEDGVTLLTPLVSGQVAKVEVVASAVGQLDAWVDFNGNGSWADAGDQIFANQTLAAGANTLTFNVPGGLKALDATYARFRFSSKGGLSFKGLAEDGEVEDYKVGVTPEPTAQLDYGDAPTAQTGALGYPTLLSQDGARHKINQRYYLGNTIDAEPDGLPTIGADGDDLNGSDDEDGVTFLTALVSGQVAKVEVKASATGQLDAWIDFNGNGSWADAGDQIFANQTLAAGANTLTFTVPSGLKGVDLTYARFRFSSKGGLSFKGLAEDGEVEDYRVGVSPEPTAQLDYGDAPTAQTGALGYPTLLSQDGARHAINQRYYLGNTIDAEPDGLPTMGADGDDLNGSDDEDGVTFLTALVSGQVAKIEVKASTTGQLDAWIDFNGNGSWADAGDQIFANLTLVAGANTLAFNVPSGLKGVDLTYARFRFSSKGGLSFKGLAEDGEVEDYKVQIRPRTLLPGISISRSIQSQLVLLTWDDASAILEGAAAVTGPWTEVSGASSPYPVKASEPSRFFRLRLTE